MENQTGWDTGDSTANFSSLKPTVLPILLPPKLLGPLAYRIFTKKYYLTLSSSALNVLATFIGRNCGSGWREQGLALRVLEEVARLWKRENGDIIVYGESDLLKKILELLQAYLVQGRLQPISHDTLLKDGLSNLSNLHSIPASSKCIDDSSLPLPNHPSSSRLLVEKTSINVHNWLKVVDAFTLPRLIYNTSTKNFQTLPATTPLHKFQLFPPPSLKTQYYHHIYHLTLQRVQKNPHFLPKVLPKLTSNSSSQNNQITRIINLLGRHNTCHILFGLLVRISNNEISLSDPSATISLDFSLTKSLPSPKLSHFTPGMFVLVDGVYFETNPLRPSNSINDAHSVTNLNIIDNNINGVFYVHFIGHPPCEPRRLTLGIHDPATPTIPGDGTDPDPHTTASASSTYTSFVTGSTFAWTNFLGLGSERETGTQMRQLQAKVYPPSSLSTTTKFTSSLIAVASCYDLSSSDTLTAIRKMFSTYSTYPPSCLPLAFVITGDFCRNVYRQSTVAVPILFSPVAALSSAVNSNSIEYKRAFDELAQVLSEFPEILARTTLIFVPGDGDPWSSSFSAGTPIPLPRFKIPSLFTKRINKVVAEANKEVWGSLAVQNQSTRPYNQGQVIWTTNPSRLTWFGCVGEMVIFRDNISSRIRHMKLSFPSDEPASRGESSTSTTSDHSTTHLPDEENDDNDSLNCQFSTTQTSTANPLIDSSQSVDNLNEARRITKILLDQSHLSPFPSTVRPILWDTARSLSLYPIPTALVIADYEAPAFTINYMGCCVMNPGYIVSDLCDSDGHIAQSTRSLAGSSVSRFCTRWVEYDINMNKASLKYAK